MVDLSIWVDEFYYVLFDHLNSMDENDKKGGKRKLVRSFSKISESIDDKSYYDKMRLASFGESFIENESLNKSQDVVAEAIEALEEETDSDREHAGPNDSVKPKSFNQTQIAIEKLEAIDERTESEREDDHAEVVPERSSKHSRKHSESDVTTP